MVSDVHIEVRGAACWEIEKERGLSWPELRVRARVDGNPMTVVQPMYDAREETITEATQLILAELASRRTPASRA